MTLPTTEPTEPTQQPDGGSFTMTINDRPQNSRVTVDPVADVANSKGLLATARTRSGSQIATRPVSGEDLVRHMGGEMTVAQAARLGLIEQRPDGSFGDTTEGQDARAAEAPEQGDGLPEADEANALEIDATLGETLADWTSALESVGANPAAVVGQVLADPTKMPEMLQRLAEDSGKDIGAMATEYQKVGTEIDRALGAYVTELGVSDIDSFWSYVHDTIGRSQLSSAVISAVFLGDASPFRDFAQKYLQSSNQELGRQGAGYGAGSTGKVSGVATTAATARRLSV